MRFPPQMAYVRSTSTTKYAERSIAKLKFQGKEGSPPSERIIPVTVSPVVGPNDQHEMGDAAAIELQLGNDTNRQRRYNESYRSVKTPPIGMSTLKLTAHHNYVPRANSRSI